MATAGALACAGALLLTGGASGASSSKPTLHVALKGTTGISVSGDEVSGAVKVVATYTGKRRAAFALVRLNPNLPAKQALAQGFGAVQTHHGNLDALTATGNRLLASANAPGTIQAVLTPGSP
jgi:hypothetical protein